MSKRFGMDQQKLIKLVETKGCLLISVESYKNQNSVLQFQCRCGTVFEKTWMNFKRSPRCSVCTTTLLKTFRKSPEFVQKRKEMSLKKYGYGNPMQRPEIKQKYKISNVERWGVENPMQRDEIKKKHKQTCLKSLGVEYPMQSENVQEKTKNTMMERWGVEHPMQSEEIKTKAKNTLMERWGVEHALQNEDLKEKFKCSSIKNWGVEHPMQSGEIQERLKTVFTETWGVEYPFQSEEIKEKCKQTSLKNWGVEYPMQNPEIAEKQAKSAFRLKPYCMKSGDLRHYQGYENLLLDELVEKYQEEDIATEKAKVPHFTYEYESKKHVYFPDAYVLSINTIYEVKSPFTLWRQPQKNLAKWKAVVEKNYIFQLNVYDCKKQLIYRKIFECLNHFDNFTLPTSKEDADIFFTK